MPVQLGKIAQLLAGLTREHEVVGAQLALHHRGRTLSVQAGRERHGGPPVGPDSVFPFGSVSKLVNATALVRSIALGRLGLDEPIEEHLPELRSDRVPRIGSVTPRHLLSHTSGLPSDHSPPAGPAPSLREYAALCRDLEPLFPPGALYSYSNVGSAVAGRLLEVVTGLDWWTAIRTAVLDPLGCASVRLVDGRDGAPVVGGHVLGPGGPVEITPSCPEYYRPAGGLAGTARDLVAFGRLHIGAAARGDDVLDDAARTLMREGAGDARPFGSTTAAGLGSHRFDTERGPWFGHDGSIEGTHCHLRYHPDQQVVVALATNTAHGGELWSDLVRGLGAAGLEVGPERDPAPPAAPVAEPPDCLGDYLSGDMRYLVRRDHDGGIRIRAGATTLVNVTFHADHVFSATDPTGPGRPVTGRFLPDSRGERIALLEVGGRVARREPAPRA
ncbi:serine hydrolase domain-containing protein [Saccharothrix sp. HUAS TT1]|uniref:serine hydrolase domain-containing protein n=1 Tax=unclassified Saccharothrix TaxID=2593673 RepID=UPI00345BB0D4